MILRLPIKQKEVTSQDDKPPSVFYNWYSIGMHDRFVLPIYSSIQGRLCFEFVNDDSLDKLWDTLQLGAWKKLVVNNCLRYWTRIRNVFYSEEK